MHQVLLRHRKNCLNTEKRFFRHLTFRGHRSPKSPHRPPAQRQPLPNPWIWRYLRRKSHRELQKGQSVKQSTILLNGTVLTLGSGNMSNVVFGTLSGHHILKVGSKVSGTMPLEQIVEQDGVVCLGCISRKTKLFDAVGVNSPGPGADMSLLLLML